MESEVFMNGSVSLAKLSSKLLERKGTVWVAKSTDIKAPDSHELVMLLWVHEIICVHWDDNTQKNNTPAKTKKHSLLVCKETSWVQHKDDPLGRRLLVTHTTCMTYDNYILR